MRDKLEKRKTRFQSPRVKKAEVVSKQSVNPFKGQTLWWEVGRNRIQGYLLEPIPSYNLKPQTMDKGAVEPLNVVVPRQWQQHLIADDGEGQEEDSTQGDRQGEGAELKPEQRKGWVCIHQILISLGLRTISCPLPPIYELLLEPAPVVINQCHPADPPTLPLPPRKVLVQGILWTFMTT